VVQQFFFSNLLVYTISILIFGTFFSFLLFFFSYKNQYQNIVKHDTIYNIIKIILLLSLGLSYIFFILFYYYYYIYYITLNNYYIYNIYTISPKIFINLFLTSFEFSIDFFGIVLLFLGYFVGILSLLALDNRIF